jgi:hypothetical protein
MTETEALEVLRDRLVGQRSGVVSVIDVRYEYPINQDNEEYLNVNLVLSDPPADQLTWPIDDVHELIRRGREEVVRLQIAPPYFVAFTSKPAPDEWDDPDGPEANA